MIQVSCAIIINQGKILSVQRGPNSDHPYKWEFPGGKIKLDETEEQSIIREIQEELQVNIKIKSRLKAVTHDYGIKRIHLIPFWCEITSGEPTLTEHISQNWIKKKDILLPDWAEADLKLIKENMDFLGIKQD